jgi:hypothetical protein
MDKRQQRGNSLKTSPRAQKDTGLSFLRNTQRTTVKKDSPSPVKKISSVFSPQGRLGQRNGSINLMQNSIESIKTTSRSPKIKIHDS